MKLWRVLVIVGLLVAGGCGGDDEDRPGRVPVFNGTTDAGRDAEVPDDEDAAVADDDAGASGEPGIVPGECEKVDPLAARNEDIPEAERPSGLMTPQDFTITRALATWDTTNCNDPKFVITLSEGFCPNGRGQSLTFTLSANAIESGDIFVGDNLLVPDGDNPEISVRYKRTPVAGEIGTCDGVTGQITFPSAPELTRGSTLFGRFQMDLTDCTGGSLPTKTFAGAFKVTVKRSRSEVCQ
jgi:hypothetical protein